MISTSMEIAGLRTIRFDATATPSLIVVMLHGYAMYPEALEPFSSSIGIPGRFLIPEGPREAEPEGRAWWEIDIAERTQTMAAGPRDLAASHPPGAPIARDRLVRFLRDVAQHWPELPIAIVGFSQGGMLACDTLLRENADVVALALLSSSRISHDEWLPLLPRLKGLPILVTHGQADPDLAFAAGEALRDMCAQAGARVTWVPFEGGHEIPLVVWRALRKFLGQTLRIAR